MESGNYQRIKQLEEVLAGSANDMQEIFYDIEKKGIADFLPINVLKSQRKQMAKNHLDVTDLMVKYMEIANCKSNKDYNKYIACVQAVQRILKGKIKKIENENIKRINNNDFDYLGSVGGEGVVDLTAYEDMSPEEIEKEMRKLDFDDDYLEGFLGDGRR